MKISVKTRKKIGIGKTINLTSPAACTQLLRGNTAAVAKEEVGMFLPHTALTA